MPVPVEVELCLGKLFLGKKFSFFHFANKIILDKLGFQMGFSVPEV